MSYPSSVAAGNVLIQAAVAWIEAQERWSRVVMSGSEDDAAWNAVCDAAEITWLAAGESFEAAVQAYREASAVEHVNGPNIDADVSPSSRSDAR